jgi:hypothetical protein
MSENTMMLVQSTWNDKQTFRMIPISESCPYVECIMDPDTKVFVIISKVTKQALHMLPKMDDNGDPIATKHARPNGRNFREERHKIEVFQEFYVEDLTAMEEVIKLFAVNSKGFDYKKFMGVEKAAPTKKTTEK